MSACTPLIMGGNVARDGHPVEQQVRSSAPDTMRDTEWTMNDADTLEVGDEDLTVTVVALEDELAVVAVGGEIDIKTAGTLWHPLDTLVDNGRRHLVLDLGAVTF